MIVRVLLICLLLIASGIAFPEQASAGCKRKHAEPGEVEVSLPVLFATDRAQILSTKKDLDFGKQTVFPVDSILYGVKRVDTTSNLDDKDDRETLTKRGWVIYPPELKKKVERQDLLKDQQAEQSHVLAGFDEFVSKTKRLLDASDRHEIVIYVHGCCLDFDGSLAQAADLASTVKVPLIAYCWGCSKGYAGSSMAFPRSQERFNRFIIQTLAAFPNEKITVVCNSIGTQLVQNFCLQRRPEDYGNKRIDQIIFSRADLDDIAFKSQLDSVVRHANKVIVFVAKNDFQINVSGTLRWFFFPTQHGERAGHLRSALQSESALTVLDVSPLKMGHVIPYESVADLLDNGGDVPKSSRLYQYTHMEDNLYRVTKTRFNAKQHATAPSVHVN